MKLNEWLDKWTNTYIKHNVKQRSMNTYMQLIEKHIKPALGEYELEDLSAQVLQNFVYSELEKGNLKTGKALANNTVIVMTNILKQAIDEANNMEVTNKNCSKKIKMPPQEEKQVTAFEKSEQDKIVKYCLENKKDNYFGIVLCLYSGLRIGELLALTWDDVDFFLIFLRISIIVFESGITLCEFFVFGVSTIICIFPSFFP